MFLHTFQYAIKYLFRQKNTLFWNLLFPIALASFFHISFSEFSANEMFQAIPVAVVLEESEFPSYFKEIIDTLNEPGEEKFFEAVYTSKEEALSLLEQKKIIGILYEGSPVTLSVSANMDSMKLEQSILACFVERYNMQYSALEQIAMNHPQNLPAAIEALAKETHYNIETSYCDGDMDEQITYFFNLIAISCLFASSGGAQIAMKIFCTNTFVFWWACSI